MRLGVIGLGLMGASFAAALRTRRPDIEVVGSDRDPVVVVTALERGLIAQPNVDGADVLFVCVPPGAMQDVLRQLPRGVLISDMASTKVSVCEWASEAGLDFVGGHPMCGREQVGIHAADPRLFEGAPWILTTESPAIEELVRAVGARPVVMDPARHDRLVAGISHAAFVVSTAYLLAVAGTSDWKDMASLAGSGFRDLTRLASGSAEMYAGIAATNGTNLAGWLRLVELQLGKLRLHVEAGDPRIVELFEEARRERERWLADS